MQKSRTKPLLNTIFLKSRNLLATAEFTACAKEALLHFNQSVNLSMSAWGMVHMTTTVF